jgi:molecular chaperone GrpE
VTDQNENKPEDNAAETPEAETGAAGGPGTEAAANDAGGPGRAEDAPDPKAEIADLKDKLLRALAETENLRRRSQKEREDALKYAASNFARDMLTVADNLRRAIDSIPENGAPDGTALVAFIEGVSLTEKELLSTLERHGIEKIDPMGQKFDPQFHEAMFEAPVPGAETGTVFQVVETGYLIHGRLLRPAKVGVAKAAPEPTEPGEQVDTKA